MSILNVLDWQLNTNYGACAKEHLGPLPLMLDPSIPKSAEEQMAEHWTLVDPDAGWSIAADDYLFGPGYPAQAPAAMARIPGATIYAYPGRFVAIVGDSGRFALGRLNDGQ